MRRTLPLVLALAACSGPAPVANQNVTTSVGAREPHAAAPPPSAADALVGRWTGVEGMYLVVTSQAADRYRLEMQWDLDHKGVFMGTRDGTGIAFEREGRRETLRPSDGDATGLKWLAGRKTCLTVKSGEGYCRA